VNVTSGEETVFLLDVDNTLLDNDQFAEDLGDHLDRAFGGSARARYWDLFNGRREQLGLADYLGSLQEFRTGLEDDPQLLRMSEFLLDYPFASLVFPEAMAAIGHLDGLGSTVVLSDGDVVFQPRKIQHAGIWGAVAGRVLIYVHKEKMLDHMQQRHPAMHYVMVDDKPNILAAMKAVLGSRLTTVFVRQGQYANDAQAHVRLPSPDLTIERIGDLIQLNLSDFQVRP
jgi:FMN phosphatase YigB (HAD superfamily)